MQTNTITWDPKSKTYIVSVGEGTKRKWSARITKPEWIKRYENAYDLAREYEADNAKLRMEIFSKQTKIYRLESEKEDLRWFIRICLFITLTLAFALAWQYFS